jgi:Ca2+-binding EF-hand superfamily protein
MPTDGQLLAVFDEIDYTKDGKVGYDEMVAALEGTPFRPNARQRAERAVALERVRRAEESAQRAEAAARAPERYELEDLRRGLADRRVSAQALFHACDLNRDNRVTFREFKQGVAAVGLRPMPSDEQLQALFLALDATGSGRLRYAEMMAGMRGEVYDGRSEVQDDWGRPFGNISGEQYGTTIPLAQTPIAEAPERFEAEDLRAQLARRGVTAGQLYTLCDPSRSNAVSFDRFVRGIEMSGIRPTPTTSQLASLWSSLIDPGATNRVDFARFTAAIEGRALDLLNSRAPAAMKGTTARGIQPVHRAPTPEDGVEGFGLEFFRHELARRAVSPEQFFLACDGDRANRVTFSQWATGVRGLGLRPPPSTAQLMKVFAMLDLGGHNRAEYGDFVSILRGEDPGQRRRRSAAASRLPTLAERIASSSAARARELEAAQYAEAEEFDLSDLAGAMRRKKISAETLFSRMDEDRRGRVPLSGFRRGVESLKILPRPTEAQVAALFTVIDSDGDGRIEFLELVKKLGTSGRKGRSIQRREGRKKSPQHLADARMERVKRRDTETAARKKVSVGEKRHVRGGRSAQVVEGNIAENSCSVDPVGRDKDEAHGPEPSVPSGPTSKRVLARPGPRSPHAKNRLRLAERSRPAFFFGSGFRPPASWRPERIRGPALPRTRMTGTRYRREVWEKNYRYDCGESGGGGAAGSASARKHLTGTEDPFGRELARRGVRWLLTAAQGCGVPGQNAEASTALRDKAQFLARRNNGCLLRSYDRIIRATTGVTAVSRRQRSQRRNMTSRNAPGHVAEQRSSEVSTRRYGRRLQI